MSSIRIIIEDFKTEKKCNWFCERFICFLLIEDIKINIKYYDKKMKISKMIFDKYLLKTNIKNEGRGILIDLFWNKIHLLKLAEFTNIIYLKVENKQIVNVRFLYYLKNLEYLNLSNNQIKNIEPIRHLLKLKTLNLENNLVENINCLKFLSKLKMLNLGKNNITSIEVFKLMKNITHLILPFKFYKNDLSFLNLKSLKFIKL